MAKRCILQIEDDEADVLLLRHAFKKAGIEDTPRVATCGREAIDYLSGSGPFSDRKNYPLPDLVLLDLKLPDKHGLEVLEWIRHQPRFATTVVIAFTSSNFDIDVRRAYELGVNSYVVKVADNNKRVELAQLLKKWWMECNEFAAQS